MKAIDVIGRTSIELKEFQHSAEFQFERQQERIEANMPIVEYETGISSLREMLDAKMNAAFQEFNDQISRLTKKTDKRLSVFDTKLKEVEANTFWKIKDYEKLLEARPTMQYVKSAITDEFRSILVKARVYTDEEI